MRTPSIYTDPNPPPLSYEQLAWIVRNGLYSQVVYTAICLYDHITTLDLEVELIWKRKISLVQVLYFTNRYIGDAVFVCAYPSHLWGPCFSNRSDPFPRRCPSFGTVNTWLSMASLFSYQGIMVHRIYSLCRRQRVVFASMMVCLGALLITGLALGIIWTVGITGVPVPYSPTLRTCIPLGWTSWSPAMWIVILTFDLAIFSLAVAEGIRYLKEHPGRLRSKEEEAIVEGVSSRFSEGSVLRIFLRDSVVFPFLGILICLSNILAWYVLPLGALQHTINLAALSSPLLGSRLILNLRDAYHRPFADEIELNHL
ncbi:hypothetical protein FA13DRAFT_1814259 [Coprinellus micaceus]|uniref:DUF6533 domain-containing protein n=1 Tax=Coprinellus micaceus TaxID=71717 RepID=A0A4Y7TA22_COPMI|nr:hypothetical protein FA13DRAFT_1814259 [Coprinellus micaceus]